MSIRPLLYPVRSVEPIRRAMGSRDEGLAGRMAAAHARLYRRPPRPDEWERIRAFVRGEVRGGPEPGEWQGAVWLAARAVGLVRRRHPVNEDCKWLAWDQFREAVAGRLPADVRPLLRWLVRGRPLRGAAVESQGSYYAWLDGPEVRRLRAGLRALEVAGLAARHRRAGRTAFAGFLEEFHGDLIEWLGACRGRALLLVAS